MTICIYNCDYDQGIDNTSLAIQKILKDFETEIFEVKDGIFPVSLDKFSGFIVTGSSVNPLDNPSWMSDLMKILETEKPVIGLCFGHEVIAIMFGGKIGKMCENNIGYSEVTINKNTDPIFEGLPERFLTFFCHHYKITELPENSEILAGDSNLISAFRFRNYLGLQFHPEISFLMAKNLEKKYNNKFKYPDTSDLGVSKKMNEKILINFADMCKSTSQSV